MSNIDQFISKYTSKTESPLDTLSAVDKLLLEDELKRKKEEEKYKGKTKEEVEVIKQTTELTALNKSEQVNMLMSLGLSSAEIKTLKYEADRVNKIIELQAKAKK